jgi:hypothetical protein
MTPAAASSAVTSLRVALLWNLLGVLDFVVGLAEGVAWRNDASMLPTVRLPVFVVILGFVPWFSALHLLCAFRVWRLIGVARRAAAGSAGV